MAILAQAPIKYRFDPCKMLLKIIYCPAYIPYFFLLVTENKTQISCTCMLCKGKEIMPKFVAVGEHAINNVKEEILEKRTCIDIISKNKTFM